MTAEKKDELYNLIQFIGMAYRDKDINEQYRDYKAEKMARMRRSAKRAETKLFLS